MDLKNLLYLEQYLKVHAKFTYAIISHDKKFLDRVINRTIIVRDQTIYSFRLNYSDALLALDKVDEDATKKRLLEEKSFITTYHFT